MFVAFPYCVVSENIHTLHGGQWKFRGGGGGGSKRTQFSALIKYHSDFLIGDPFCGIIVAAGCFTSRIMAFVKSLALKRGK